VTAIVETRSGRLEGRPADERGVRAWRGVPYAAAPVGKRRFQLAAPVPSWTGVRPASERAAAPLQAVGPAAGPGLVPGMDPGPISEDCLYLDVWVPPGATPADPRPVMVWIPGGAFSMGAGSLPTYDGARLAAEGDVIVVSISYRLGALGFLVLDGVQPNVGLVDQAVALAWVQDNIAVFGGDRDNVTVFGESAGGGSICHLLAARLARGLFRRAIVQSGATGLTLTVDSAARVAERLLAAAGVADVAGLRALPGEAIVAAQTKATWELFETVGVMPFHPCFDGGVVKDWPLAQRHAGHAANVDLLIGTTAQEMLLYTDLGEPDLDRDRLVKRLARYLDGRPDRGPIVPGRALSADELLSVYEQTAGASHETQGSRALALIWSDIQTDGEMTTWAERTASAHAEHQPATYRYVFTWEAAARDGALGAHHAVDLPFTFGTFDVDGWGDWVGFTGPGSAADAVGVDLRRRWTAFAHTGSPGADWPRYRGGPDGDRSCYLFGRDPGVVADWHGERRRAWDGR
jgi:para-nitrobenzyl esterase